MIMENKLREEISKIICKITEIPAEKLKGEANFIDDLGVESIMAIEIVFAIEKKYNLEIPEERLGEIDCLDSCVGLVKELLS